MSRAYLLLAFLTLAIKVLVPDTYMPFNPSIITFHYEACKNDEEVINYINYIKKNGIKPAISIKPNTFP